MSKKTFWFAIGVFMLAMVAAVAGFDHLDERITTMIVTVFSVFAGFLVAIIAMVGETSLIGQGDWGDATQYRTMLMNHLTNLKRLLVVYIFTLLIIFASILLEALEIPLLDNWIKATYLFLATVAMSITLRLPGWMIEFHQWKVDEIVALKRRQAGMRN